MAEPITFYQQWAAAWQQVDKYSTNPWCVDSKNLDIFSDSQAIKGMAWSDKETISDDWVDVDPKWRFYLAADGRVYDSVDKVWYNHDKFDQYSNKIDYADWEWYVKAQFWTPKKLMVAYSWDDWMTISVVTDRLMYNIYHYPVLLDGRLSSSQNCQNDWNTSATYRVAITSTSSWHGNVSADQTIQFAVVDYRIDFAWDTFNNVRTSVYSNWIKWNNTIHDFDITKSNYSDWALILNENIWTIQAWGKLEWETYLDNFFNETSWSQALQSWFRIDFSWTSTDAFYYVYFYMKEQWRYLYPKEDRKIIEIEDEYYLEWLDSTQYEMLYYDPLESKDWETYYELITGNAFDLPDWYDIVAFARWFDFQYAFVNKWDMWIVYYMTDVNLATWDVGRRFPWTQFINAIMIGNYVYVLAEKRGVRGLYIFSQWDMKLLVWADKKYTESESLIDWKEIYNFSWIMANWRDRVVCATDNTVFMWWRNKLWANVWAFVLKVDWTITSINTERWSLDVYFTKNQVNYRKSIQDDVNIVHHESDWSVTYPIQINTHLIEKEPMKMEVSYNLPNSSTQLDVYINVNDYYFWTFESDTQAELTAWDKFKLVWCWWNYWLIFIEKIWNLLTFYLDGDLPYQVNNTKQIISEDTNTTINFTALNHFKHIWSCTKDSEYYPEWKYTILNIANRNNLPTVRKLQVKIVWTNTEHSSPELYAIRLLSNQFDK